MSAIAGATTGPYATARSTTRGGASRALAAAEFERRVRDREGKPQRERAVDHAVALYRTHSGDATGPPGAFVTGADVEPESQLAMQSALQAHGDNAISKTVGVPAQFEFVRFRRLFDRAYALGLKGCTTFRPNAITGSVLARADDVDACCTPAPGEGGPCAGGDRAGRGGR